MDLVDPASIDAFAERFLSSGEALDILVLSAGIMALPARALDARGLEFQFATNHLGHFQLTGRLWPARGWLIQGAEVCPLCSSHPICPKRKVSEVRSIAALQRFSGRAMFYLKNSLI